MCVDEVSLGIAGKSFQVYLGFINNNAPYTYHRIDWQVDKETSDLTWKVLTIGLDCSLELHGNYWYTKDLP